MNLHTYVVRYDSGFAPNPFYGYCTLATCKPDIRRTALVGDWLLGTGSAAAPISRGGHLVYAMRITETMSFQQYDSDQRFDSKKPYRHGSRKQSCGDNIYFKNDNQNIWRQRDSFHSSENGIQRLDHTNKDTKINRVLISNDYVYFGGYGPAIPPELRAFAGTDICWKWVGQKTHDNPVLIDAFATWIRSLDVTGYQSAPYEWKVLRGK
jgi:hypothetical protein